MSPAVIIGIIVVLIVLAIGAYEYHKKHKKATGCSATNPCPAPQTCSAAGACTPAPRPSAAVVTDCGYPTPRGWYDVQKQGVKNDYCRNVGGPGPVWFSCALAGTTTSANQYTPQTQVVDPASSHDALVTGDICFQ